MMTQEPSSYVSYWKQGWKKLKKEKFGGKCSKLSMTNKYDLKINLLLLFIFNYKN
jgi:hypothetical protein